MTARTDFLDARLRYAHELASAGKTTAQIAALLSAGAEYVEHLLATDPGEPLPGSLRDRCLRAEMRAERFEREYEGCQRRLAAATNDQLAMVLDMDRLRRKVSSAPPVCEDALR